MTDSDLAKPFLVAPGREHQFLTLRHYFQALETLAMKALPYTSAAEAVMTPENQKILPQTLTIRSEKHGTLYHIASVESNSGETSRKFTISTAVSDLGRNTLLRDSGIISYLHEKISLPYLPIIFYQEQVSVSSGQKAEQLLMVAGEWFEDYHEWHLTGDGEGISIWDYNRGIRPASDEEKEAVFRNAARILTLYYDLETGEQIYPWHHAAGDFIVKGDGSAQLRLTTARGYDPVFPPSLNDGNSQLAALLSFFLHMTVRMRLDRVEGVDEPVWSGDFAVRSTIAGFFNAIEEKMKSSHSLPCLSASDLLALMKSFDVEDFTAIILPYLDLYDSENPDECTLIRKMLSSHMRDLSMALEDFNLERT